MTALFVIVGVAFVALLLLGPRYGAALERRARGEHEIDFIFPSAGPIEGGAVSYQALEPDLGLPTVENAAVWGPPKQPDVPTFEEALGTIIAQGDALRLCSNCGSPATMVVAQEYELRDGRDVWIRLDEQCADCGMGTIYHVTPALWTAMEASRVWSQGKLARTTLTMALRNQQADLDALDADAEGRTQPPSSDGE